MSWRESEQKRLASEAVPSKEKHGLAEDDSTDILRDEREIR
jgi:hypothetical protein